MTNPNQPSPMSSCGDDDALHGLTPNEKRDFNRRMGQDALNKDRASIAGASLMHWSVAQPGARRS